MMVDMHCHLLFGVDDGPKTIEETMKIAEKAWKEGITDMIATPHAFSPHYHVSKSKIEGQLPLLINALHANDCPINLHMGQELRLHEDLDEKISTGTAMTLAGSKYVLLELPSHSVPSYAVTIIQSMLEKGNIPIIAHPERNRSIADRPELLERLVRQGALAQVTAGSLTGYFGKQTQKVALQLIEANLIHTYGSDVHGIDVRPLLFNEGLNYLEKKKLHDMVDILLENNDRILKDEAFIILDPETPILRKWWRSSTTTKGAGAHAIYE